jgi:hypothetical protein
MSIDFDGLVLGVTMETFALTALCKPVTSRPGKPPYAIRGIWSSQPVDVAMADDAIFSDQQTTFGIRYAELPAGPPPSRNDIIEMTDASHAASYGTRWFIGDVDDDGQGGAMIALRTQEDMG